MNSSIYFSNVSIDYNQNSIVKDLNLDIQEGSWIEIIGSNNVGKSSLLNTLYGLSHNLTGGLKILGYDLNPLTGNIQELRRKIGFFSDALPLIENKTFRANLSLALTSSNNIFDLESDAFLNSILDKLHLKHKLLEVIENFSSSDKTLSKLVRLLSIKPKLLLLDCPFRTLDKINSELVVELLKKYHTSEKATIIITSDAITTNGPDGRMIYLMENQSLKHINKL
ncbi:MAG: ATP-binding cassette domain-containing protein [Saprospiraceae bacterium]